MIRILFLAEGLPEFSRRHADILFKHRVEVAYTAVPQPVRDLLIMVFVFGMLWFFREPLEQMVRTPELAQVSPEMAAEYERQVEEKNKELDAEFEIERAPQPQPIILPYEYLPNPELRAQACFQAIAFLMQPITGWNQVSAECGETHASVVFNRDFGTLGDFYVAATDLMPGSFVQQESDSRLYVRATLPTVPTMASLDERDVETVMRDVLTVFQYGNMAADVQMVTDTLTNGVDTVKLDIVEVAATSKLTPVQFMKLFDEFGGVYMTRCTWDASTRDWNYEVIIYAK